MNHHHNHHQNSNINITTTRKNSQQSQQQQQPKYQTTTTTSSTTEEVLFTNNMLKQASAEAGAQLRNEARRARRGDDTREEKHHNATKAEDTTTAIFPEKFLTFTPPTARQQDRSEAFADSEIRRATKEHNKTHMAALVPFVVGALEGAINRSARTGAKTLEKEEEENSDGTSTSTSPPPFFEFTGTAITNAATLASAVEYVMMHTVDSAATYVGALVLMDRLYLAKVKSGEDKMPTLTYKNAYGIFVACARVASKVVEIRCMNNKDWATAARISVVRLNMIESALLRRLQFNVMIRKTEWECYAAQILGTGTASSKVGGDIAATDDKKDSCYIPLNDDVAVSPASSLGETPDAVPRPHPSAASSSRGAAAAAIVLAPIPKTTTRSFKANDTL